MKRLISTLFLFVFLVSTRLFAVADTTLITNDGTIGKINDVIQGDTLGDGSRNNPDRVYMLERGGEYVLNGWITVKTGTHIRIIGQEAPATGTDYGPAVIIMGVQSGLYYNYLFDCYGDLTLKNVWLAYVNTVGSTSWTTIQFENDNLHGYFDHVIFESSQAPAITIAGKNFTTYTTNCFFRNCIDPTQWWAGRQIYFLSASTGDTVFCENNTFENMGFCYQTQGVPVKVTWYNHNTFLNVSKFAFLESYWTYAVITNNVFVNCHFTGERKSDRAGQDPDGLLYGAVLNADTLNAGTTYLTTEAGRTLLFYNNSNFLDPRFQTFYDTYNNNVSTSDSLILAEPMYNNRTDALFDPVMHPNFKRNNNYDGEDPGFAKPGTQMDSILAFLAVRYAGGSTSIRWGYDPDVNSFGDPATVIFGWPMPEDLAYTNTTLLTGATHGYPVGDLNWFPSKLASWSSQSNQERADILADVKEKPSGTIPVTYKLDQNYPNPFNPTTTINFAVPKAGDVKLVVYNMLGQQVRTLFTGNVTTGNYTATWDGKDNKGMNVSSGIYFYQLSAGSNFVATKKMMLLK